MEERLPLCPSAAAAFSNELIGEFDNLARETKFIRRESGSFSAGGFVLTQLKAVASGEASFNQMASSLGRCEKWAQSRQALHKRIGQSAVDFMAEAVKVAISRRCGALEQTCRGAFAAVHVEDSTQHKMAKANSGDFPAHGNGHGATAGCKVDLSFDLLGGEPGALSFDGPGQRAGQKPRRYGGRGRAGLTRHGLFFGRRVRAHRGPRGVLAEPAAGRGGRGVTGGQKLEDHLRRTRAGTVNIVDIGGARLGVAAHGVRLVAVRADKAVADKRRRERRAAAKKAGVTVPKDTLLRDGWHIMVTNVGSDRFGAGDLAAFYSLRWQIEIVFRAWKQSGNLAAALDRKSNPNHLTGLVHAAILWLILTMKTASVLQAHAGVNSRVVSIEKLAKDMAVHLLTLVSLDGLSAYTAHWRHILMEPRKREPLMAKGLRLLG